MNSVTRTTDAPSSSNVPIEVITTPEQLIRFVKQYKLYDGPVVYDTETDGLFAFKTNRIIGYAFYLPAKKDFAGLAVYIPVRHAKLLHRCVRWKPIEHQPTNRKKLFPEDQERFPDGIVYQRIPGKNHPIDLNLDPGFVAKVLAPCFGDGRKMLGFNIKFDKHFTEKEGIEFNNPTYDVMLACQIDDENSVSYSMDMMGPKYCGPDATKYDKQLLEWAKVAWKNKRLAMKTLKGRLRECPLFMVGEYGAYDCILTWEIAKKVAHSLKKQGLMALSREIATDYSEAYQRVEKNGILVNQEYAIRSMEHAEQRIQLLYEAMVEKVGYEFNPGSNHQVAKILYGWEPKYFTNTFLDENGQVKTKRIKSPQPSTDKAALAASKHPIAPILEEYREWTKSLQTYYRPWMTHCDANGRLHPNIKIEGTVAGRPSCTAPNMMNLPRTDERTTYDCRGAIVAAPGNILLSRDMSQIELRGAAQYSKDPAWTDAYMNGEDIHQATADMLCEMGVNVTRQDAKTINFAMLYNMGPPALSKKLGVSEAKAKDILQGFKYSKPKLVKLQRDVERHARDFGYIELWTGRRRRYPHDWMVGTALNNLIQGFAAEVLRHSVIKLDKMLRETNVKIILTIYDDILFEMPEEEVLYWNPKIKAVMDDWPQFQIPILSEGKAGYSWSEMVKCDKPFKIGDRVKCSFTYEPGQEYEGIIIPCSDPKRADQTEFLPLNNRSIDVKIEGKTKRSVLCGTDKIDFWKG